MNKLRKSLTIIMVLAITMFSLCACGNQKNEVKSVIKKFESACNNADINTMLECIDPAISEKVKLATGLASIFISMDSNELLDALAGVLIKDNALNTKEFFSSIKISVEDVAVTENSATAMAIVEYSVGEENFKKDATFKCVYSSEKWYISGFDFE